MSDWTVAWIVWLVFFVVVEGAALIKKAPNATLSSHVWKWFSIRNKSTGYKVRRLALVFLLAYLCVHFLTGGFV